MTNSPPTEAFIRDLARRPAPAPLRPALVALAVAGAILAGLALFFALFGLRPDPGAMARPVVAAKALLPLALAGLALPLALVSVRPGARLPLWPLLVPAALAAGLFAARLIELPPQRLLPDLMGQTALACLISIVTLSLLPLAAGLALLRRGAPTRPVLSGALTGLAASAGTAAGYALHCTEDSPLFYVSWYGLALCLASALGAWLGHRHLRW